MVFFVKFVRVCVFASDPMHRDTEIAASGGEWHLVPAELPALRGFVELELIFWKGQGRACAIKRGQEGCGILWDLEIGGQAGTATSPGKVKHISASTGNTQTARGPANLALGFPRPPSRLHHQHRLKCLFQLGKGSRYKQEGEKRAWEIKLAASVRSDQPSSEKHLIPTRTQTPNEPCDLEDRFQDFSALKH